VITLIDTDIIIDLTREHPREEAVEWFETLLETPSIPSTVALELLQGASHKEELRFLEEFLSEFDLIYHSQQDQILGYKLIKEFALSHRLQLGDALIASTAINNSATLYTLNEKHFRAIPALSYKVPYRKN
jgi:hypothetical protein